MKKALASFLLALSLGVVLTAQAQEPPMPDQLVRQTTDKIMALLKANHATYERDHRKLYAMVYEYILPHFDFTVMSKLVLGRYWREATPAQRAEFSNEFRDLLVRTYSTALLKYTNEDIVYLPFTGKPTDETVLVRTEVKQLGGGPSIPINYSFYHKDGGWKVYDVTIDGVSLVTNYRSVYADKIEQQGMDALIASLAATPRQPLKQTPQ